LSPAAEPPIPEQLFSLSAIPTDSLSFLSAQPSCATIGKHLAEGDFGAPVEDAPADVGKNLTQYLSKELQPCEKSIVYPFTFQG
jgi:hypothetical protein